MSVWSSSGVVRLAFFALTLVPAATAEAQDQPQTPLQSQTQAPAAASPPGAAPTSGDTVTFADLDGMVMVAKVVQDRTLRHNGKIIKSTNITERRIAFGPGDSLRLDVKFSAEVGGAIKQARPMGGMFELGKPRAVNNFGGGESVWIFDAGKLTLLRIIKEGAFRVTFTFSRSPDGLRCSYDSAMARENGTGAIIGMGEVGHGEFEIVSTKLVSSECKVARASN